MDPKEKETKFKGKGKPRKGDKREKDSKFPKDKFPKDKEFVKHGHNNIKWRTADETMTNLVARLPFGQPLGIPQRLVMDGSNATIARTLPGIMSVRTRLTAGGNTGSNSYNSAINLAGRKLYSYIRHANSGSKNYEAVDLVMYLLAIQQALGLLGWIQRAYRLVNEYSTSNRYTPAMILRTMGLDADDLIANQPQLKYLIAWFGRALGALAFPDIPIMHASYEAYKWIIRDSDSPKEQYYFIDSVGFGQYNPTLTSAGGGITYTGAPTWADPGMPFTFTTLYYYVHSIMDVLLSDEDCGIISGDILKAYREGGLFKIEAFGDYDVFKKDDELLQQIHNCHVIPESVAALDCYEQIVGGTSQAPYVQPKFTNPATGSTAILSNNLGDKLLIDAFSKVPEADEVVNCTVLNPQYKVGFVVGANQIFLDTATLAFDLHLPVDICIAPNLDPAYITSCGVLFDRWKNLSTNKTMTQIDVVTPFDWHPFVWKIEQTGSTSFALFCCGDHQNSRFFDYEVGVRIHENSILSLLDFQNTNAYK